MARPATSHSRKDDPEYHQHNGHNQNPERKIERHESKEDGADQPTDTAQYSLKHDHGVQGYEVRTHIRPASRTNKLPPTMNAGAASEPMKESRLAVVLPSNRKKPPCCIE